MKASLDSVRIAPKKANLIARMVRGLTVPEAMDQLSRTNKKAARLIEELLRSAIANASHNDKQDAQMMVLKTIVVNQGQAYHRGMPMARGRTRPFRKFLSHIEITLGFAGDDAVEKKQKNTKATKQKTARKEGKTSKDEGTASQKPKNPVKNASSRKKTTDASSSDSSVSSDSSISS